MLVNIREVVQEYIKSNGDDAWKNLDNHKSKVKSEYISELKRREPHKDAKQSWRSVSGDFLELFVESYISDNTSSGTEISRESETPQTVKDSIRLEFNSESVLPDSDVIVHDGQEASAIISCKSSIRERVSQTLFWKISIEEQIGHIDFHFVTMDSDDELAEGLKWRPIVSDAMDGVYVFETGDKIDDKIRPFPELRKKLE